MNEQIFWIILKRLRFPFLVLILTFAVTIIGLVFIPGVDDNGHVYHMTFFDAFYFVSYMASTIGFGEAPYTFTYPQRMWVSGSIYIAVIGWFYGVGSIIALIQDEALKKAMNRNRFRKQVLGLKKPFYIMLGYNSIIKSLIERINKDQYRVVVLDKSEAKIDDLMLENFNPIVPAFVGEATNQMTLKMAGIHQKNCLGIISLFEDDKKNTHIATIAKLLNKRVNLIVKASSQQHLEHFKSMKIEHVQNPFEIISNRFYQGLVSPNIWLLEMWFYGHSLNLRKRDLLPHGKYIICGYGRMGQALENALIKAGVEYSLYDITSVGYEEKKKTTIFGDAEDRQELLDLGVQSAECIIAATKDDLLNLTILNKAKMLNPNIFTIARENSLEELTIFKAAKVNRIYVLEKILADSTYSYISRPLAEHFIKEIRKKDEEWAKVMVKMLNNIAGVNPDYFELTINEENTYALSRELKNGTKIPLSTLRKSREDRTKFLHVVYLLLKREDQIYLMPESDFNVKLGDQLLIVAKEDDREDFEYIINNIYELDYVLGRE